MPLFDLFPLLEPHAQGMLRVDALHTLYWEESGNPTGVPVVFLHGGPGAASAPQHRRFFDPAVWRIIMFDQRGCGRSVPLYETRDNTTDHLVSDIEALRQHRGIDRWHVLGGSWGSTLALAYAEAHPAQCLGLILRGICLMRPQEIDWFLYGVRAIFPEIWGAFAAAVNYQPGDNILDAYLRRFTQGSPDEKQAAMQAWYAFESSCASLIMSPAPLLPPNSALPLIEAHYFKNNLFTPENDLMLRIDKIRAIPGLIIQGRYDCVCPIVTAHELHQHWPEAEYRVIPDAGHSIREPGIAAALVEATEQFKNIRS